MYSFPYQGDSLPPPPRAQNATSGGTNTSRIRIAFIGASKNQLDQNRYSLHGTKSFKVKKPLQFPHRKQQHEPIKFPGTKIIRESPNPKGRPFKGNKKPISFSITNISRKRSGPMNRKPRSSQTSKRDQEEHFDISNSNDDRNTPGDIEDVDGNSASRFVGKSHSGKFEGIPIVEESNELHRVGAPTAHVRENSKDQKVKQNMQVPNTFPI